VLVHDHYLGLSFCDCSAVDQRRGRDAYADVKGSQAAFVRLTKRVIMSRPAIEDLLCAYGHEICLAMEGDPYQYRGGEDSGGGKVDGGAERWPPAHVPDELSAVLPQILQAVAG
jgi:hypothetical protein